MKTCNWHVEIKHSKLVTQLANNMVLTLKYFLPDIVVYPAGHFGRGYGPETIDNVACTGLETPLLSCPHNKSSLSSYNAAAMKCQRGNVSLMVGSGHHPFLIVLSLSCMI